MKTLGKALLAASSCILFSSPVYSATFNLAGKIDFQKDIVFSYFSLENSNTVSLWTDSYQDGANFDPILSLWDSNDMLVRLNDDSDIRRPGQEGRLSDSGMTLGLSAGNYLVTPTAWDNLPANFQFGGINNLSLSEGFFFDDRPAIALEDWDQPASQTDEPGTGGEWSLWLTGVDSASLTPPTNPTDPTEPIEVPEPAPLILMGLGLAAMAFKRSKSRA